MLAAWWVIEMIAQRPPRRLATVVLATFGAGLAIAFLPLAPLTVDEAAAHRVTAFGASLAGLATLATAVVLVWTLFAALIDRL